MPNKLLVQCPTLSGTTNMASVRKAIPYIKNKGWDGCAFNSPIQFVNDDLNPNLTEFREGLNLLLTNGLVDNICRLGTNLKHNAFFKNLNGGNDWETQHYLPDGLLQACARLHWMFRIEAEKIYLERGFDPLRMKFSSFNEPGFGGAGGPHIGSLTQRSYPAEFLEGKTWQERDGEIHWRMIRMGQRIIKGSRMAGLARYAPCFESAGGETGDKELASYTGEYAEKLSKACDGFAINVYAGDCTSPSQVYDNLLGRLHSRHDRARANSNLSNTSTVECIVQETGVQIARMKGTNPDPYAYRIEGLRAARDFDPGDGWGGILCTFTLIDNPQDPLDNDYNLLTYDSSGNVIPVGSKEVCPANL
jgi:hypothetical protein